MSIDDQRDPDYVTRTWDSYRVHEDVSSAAAGDTATSRDAGRETYDARVTGRGLHTAAREDADEPPVTRRARLRLSRIDPVSAAKVGFVISLVCFVVLFVAVAVLYGVLAAMGVFEAVDSTVTSLAGSETQLFPASSVFGYTFLVGLLNVVLITMLATVGAVVYNVIADLLGGIEMTFTEGDGG